MHAPAPPPGPGRSLGDDRAAAGVAPHVLQLVALLAYFATAVALVAWTLRDSSNPPRERDDFVHLKLPLILYAGLLGLAIARPRAPRRQWTAFVVTLVLVVAHALAGLSGAVCLVAYGTLSRAVQDGGIVPLLASYVALHAGLLIGLLLMACSRRALAYFAVCVGVFAWLWHSGIFAWLWISGILLPSIDVPLG